MRVQERPQRLKHDIAVCDAARARAGAHAHELGGIICAYGGSIMLANEHRDPVTREKWTAEAMKYERALRSFSKFGDIEIVRKIVNGEL